VATTLIYRGENRLLTRPLKQSSGLALPVVALSAIKVELIQRGKVRHTFVLGTDGELRAGDDGNSLVLELTSAVTTALEPTNLLERYTLELGDNRFVSEPDKAIHVLELREVLVR
jgi:hypothetical protein